MSDHPTEGVGAPLGQERQDPDRPTTQLPAGETAGDSGEAPTRAFAGFRTERRFSESETHAVPPPPARAEPRAWAATTPAKGLPTITDAQPYGYFGGQPADTSVETAQRPAGTPPPRYPELSTSTLLRQVKPPPSEGWRRWLYMVSGKLINLGESPRVNRYNDLVVQVNRPLRGCYRIALLSLKGGVGKTTITATLGGTFASIRGDRVVAVDANPDRGTLSQKVPVETPATVRHLLRDADGIDRYSDVRSYTSVGPSRLEVLASETDPAVSEAFSADDYARTLEILERFYGLVLTDCGTGLLHSAMSAVLAKADVLIVVSSASIDGARSASATLDWLDAHGYEELVRGSIAVINAVRPRSGKVDMQKVVDHFSRRCRAVRLVPFDPHLEEGAEIRFERLKRETREALMELAAVVADGFPNDQRRTNPAFI
ncbi:MinD/ParA family ATP-binding protein [Mycobacterium kansasii]|uniref:Sporulation initiation inhibitor protein Soj n=3 Tax=Mycobacterium kansasii TaxID=1768 RepID=A0A653F3V2_MYCKA|nr:MinD/ParA family protein [Mycobacterium kansasii]AGZ52088.1 ATPase [Mycobacterium kansasii ATCC 12478]ARG56220.1 ATPase [Mycobacterium kansasii]ARG61666.1 ATPase [Mycobacterium kansasii]ARG76024.1 ATPase [Mycobacterium kansasii]ARG81560.1 ATPase [Mycobacterium kansasii]